MLAEAEASALPPSSAGFSLRDRAITRRRACRADRSTPALPTRAAMRRCRRAVPPAVSDRAARRAVDLRKAGPVHRRQPFGRCESPRLRRRRLPHERIRTSGMLPAAAICESPTIRSVRSWASTGARMHVEVAFENDVLASAPRRPRGHAIGQRADGDRGNEDRRRQPAGGTDVHGRS